MSTVKCAFGCIVEIDDDELLKIDVTCPQCHRTSKKRTFQDATDSKVVLDITSSVSGFQKIRPLFGIPPVQDLIKGKISELFDIEKSTLFTKKAKRESRYATKLTMIYQNLMTGMIKAELTTNFPTVYLEAILDSGKVSNMWDLGTEVDNSLSSGKKAYSGRRNDVEILAFGTHSSKLSRIKPKGKNRPCYFVLNVGNVLPGGAPDYGASYVVYHDAVKMRCTFTATDTMLMETSTDGLSINDVVTFGNIERLFLRITPKTFKYLCELTSGFPLSAGKSMEMIEAQGWGNLSLSKDVKALIISDYDLNEWARFQKGDRYLPESLKDTVPGIDRTKLIAAIKEKVRVYCERHNIELHFLPLNVALTGRSIEPRPTK